MWLPSGPSSFPASIFGSVPLSLVLSTAVFEALSGSTQGKEPFGQGQFWFVTSRSHGNSLVVNKKEAIWRRGRCAETKGPGTWWTSQAGVSASPREAKGLCTPCCTPTLRSRQLPSLHPSLGRGCHLGGVTFQGSEVEFQIILSSWYELCFLPRQNWQSMGKFYFER